MNIEDLKIDIDNESLHIYYADDKGENILSVCYWHIEEVEEDAIVCISMLNAVRLFYTDKQKLIDLLNFKALLPVRRNMEKKLINNK